MILKNLQNPRKSIVKLTWVEKGTTNSLITSNSPNYLKSNATNSQSETNGNHANAISHSLVTNPNHIPSSSCTLADNSITSTPKNFTKSHKPQYEFLFPKWLLKYTHYTSISFNLHLQYYTIYSNSWCQGSTTEFPNNQHTIENKGWTTTEPTNNDIHQEDKQCHPIGNRNQSSYKGSPDVAKQTLKLWFNSIKFQKTPLQSQWRLTMLPTNLSTLRIHRQYSKFVHCGARISKSTLSHTRVLSDPMDIGSILMAPNDSHASMGVVCLEFTKSSTTTSTRQSKRNSNRLYQYLAWLFGSPEPFRGAVVS